MVDIHDRRPLVLDPALAREWLEPDLDTRRARQDHVPAYWFAVDRAVGV
jgi:putative SOS response-associated peptidase YedK